MPLSQPGGELRIGRTRLQLALVLPAAFIGQEPPFLGAGLFDELPAENVVLQINALGQRARLDVLILGFLTSVTGARGAMLGHPDFD